MAFTPSLILVTVPALEQARGLAKLILEQRLAACVNLVPGLESHYWWEDKMETSAEVMLMIKSTEEHFERLAELIALHHPYDCPEIVSISPERMAPIYRAWWEQSVTG